jgi:hypothetical protein
LVGSSAMPFSRNFLLSLSMCEVGICMSLHLSTYAPRSRCCQQHTKVLHMHYIIPRHPPPLPYLVKPSFYPFIKIHETTFMLVLHTMSHSLHPCH